MAPTRPAAEVKTNADGSVTVQYVPSTSGPHDVNVTYNEQPVAGTPIRLNVDATDGKYVTAYGPGLLSGTSGEKLEFYVTGSKSNIQVSVDGPGKADVVSMEEKGGLVTVVYTPLSPGEYDIHVKSKGKAIHGSPFSAKISGEGRKRSQLAIPATSEYNLGGANIDLTNMIGIIKAPNGTAEPCLLKRMADGKLGVASFQPKQKGTYKIDVTQDGKAIQGSPFQITINDQHICSAHKVKVSGAFREAVANKWNDVTINIGEAGYGSLGISVEGAHRSDLELKSTSPTDYTLQYIHTGAHRSDLELKGTSPTDYTLQYKPHEPGVYMLNIKFGDDHITGSPFLVSVGGEKSGRIRETVVKDVQQIQAAFPKEDCHLELKIPGTDPLDMEATLTSPSGKTDCCEIRGMGDNLCSLRFTPMEEGVHTISLKYKGIHFAGSPFQYTVGTIPSGGTHKVEFGGPGVEQGEVESKNEFNIYYREAGPGTISISIEGPDKAKMDVIDKGNGYITVAYVVQKEGDYGVHVKFNDQHVPESPAMVHVLPLSRDAKKVQIVGLRDRGLDVNKPATFSLQMNGAFGDLKAHVSTPSGTEEDVFIQEIDDDKNSLRFLPKENGIYYVHIKLNEAHIPGSPLPMLIGKLGADPALVFANGAGLEKAEVGKPNKFTVVTSNAGAGTLAVNVEGPSKVALVCTEVETGYEFTYTPMSPGVYMIMIKYSNITIAGAPFKATVTGQGKKGDINETSSIFVETVEKKPGVVSVKKFHGDASRVVASGNGLKKGFNGRAAAFTIDFKDAGQGQFTMGLLSPSGNPVSELSFKKARAKVYNVSYVAQEKGDHVMTIRWGNEDIPGSPFTIPVS